MFIDWFVQCWAFVACSPMLSSYEVAFRITKKFNTTERWRSSVDLHCVGNVVHGTLFFFHVHSTVERMGRLIWWHIGIALLM